MRVVASGAVAWALVLMGCDDSAGRQAAGPEAAQCVGAKCDHTGDSADDGEGEASELPPALVNGHDVILECNAEIDELIAPGNAWHFRYHLPGVEVEQAIANVAEYLGVHAERCYYDAGEALRSYLVELDAESADSLVFHETRYEQEMCALMSATHSLLIADYLAMECERRGTLHRGSMLMWAAGIAEDDELLAAQYYPECFADFESPEVSGGKVLECIRAVQAPTVELAQEILEFEGTPADDVAQCLDFDGGRDFLRFHCRDALRDVGHDVDVEDGRVNLCMAEVESAFGPMFSSIARFAKPQGDPPDCN